MSFDGTFEAVDLVFWCSLALVGEALAFVRDVVALVRDPVAFVSERRGSLTRPPIGTLTWAGGASSALAWA